MKQKIYLFRSYYVFLVMDGTELLLVLVVLLKF